MRKFNLKEALAGMPLMTRDGQVVSNFKYNLNGVKYSYKADVGNSWKAYNQEGRYIDQSIDHNLDLFMADESKEMKKLTQEQIEMLELWMNNPGECDWESYDEEMDWRLTGFDYGELPRKIIEGLKIRIKPKNKTVYFALVKTEGSGDWFTLHAKEKHALEAYGERLISPIYEQEVPV